MVRCACRSIYPSDFLLFPSAVFLLFPLGNIFIKREKEIRAMRLFKTEISMWCSVGRLKKEEIIRCEMVRKNV